MNYKLDDWHRDVPKEELFRNLNEVWDKLGRQPRRTEMKRPLSQYSGGTYERRFSGWRRALEEFVAFNSSYQLEQWNRGITTAELFENLAEVWQKLGRQPRREEMAQPLSRFSKGTYEARFDGWRSALEAFVRYAHNGISQDAEQKQPSLPRGRSGPRFPNWRLRHLVMKRDSFKCCSCGASPATMLGTTLQVDHVVSWRNGGRTVMENLQTLCEKCNIGKGATGADVILAHLQPPGIASFRISRKTARITD
jgi:5-methylcytosine-specific restriction endonuclease McrA